VFIPYQLVEYLEWGYNLPNQFKRGLGMGLVGSGGVKGFLIFILAVVKLVGGLYKKYFWFNWIEIFE
jgi:hypothetical protein